LEDLARQPIFATDMKIKTPSKTGWLRLMMIGTQAMLTVMVGLWLRMQYHDQAGLFDKLTNQIKTEVEREVLDSALMIKFVKPMLDTGERINMQFTFSTDSIRRISKEFSKQPITTMKQGENQVLKADQGSIAIAYTDTVRLQNHEKAITVKTKFQKTSLMIQGVKLFINEFTDSTKAFAYFTDSLLRFPDTALYLKKLRARMMDELPGIEARLAEPNTVEPTLHDSLFPLSKPAPLNPFPEIRFSGREAHIIRQMIPETIFAFLVLILAASAFTVSFRNLKNQMALNLMRENFISNISHELKTPVATVKVALEALQNYNQKSDPDKLSRYLTMAGQEMNRLELLINRVLNTSGHVPKKGLLVTEQIDLKQLIEETTLLMTPQSEKVDATFNLRMMPEDCPFKGDRLQLQGMLVNLIDNALKYGGTTPKIEINLFMDPDTIRIVVSDQGPGIPAQYHQKVFERFFRVSTGDVHTIKGHGLGLTYARMVAELHGGKIELTTPETGGARFTIKLPIA